jgi:uncharacterized protein (DUF305 family)
MFTTRHITNDQSLEATTSQPMRRARLRVLVTEVLIAAALAVPAAAMAGDGNEQSFMAENMAAMDRMMAAMHTAASGDVDRDFVAMMVPHHQGAIDMARSELLHGRNERLRRMAQEIVVTQQDEIRVMRLAIGKSP